MLAQAGCRVRVWEGQPTIGGGLRSSELTLPGFLHDQCSAVHPLAVGSPFFDGLPLARLGLEWVHSDIPLAHPLDDGSAAVLFRSIEQTSAALGGDGAAWSRLMAPLVGNWKVLASEFLQPILHMPRHPLILARFGMLALRSAMQLASSAFRGEQARALFAGIAAHSFLPLEAPVSASFALVLGAAGHAVGWPMPRGGAQSIAEALAAHLHELGGQIETSRPVDDVREFPSDTTALLDLSAWEAARVGRHRLPSSYRRKLERFRHGPGVFKVDYALAAPIPWAAEECRRAGTVHLGGTSGEIAEAERQVACGEIPGRPFVLLTQPSLFDTTRAPMGKHTAWAYCHVPFGCGEDMTDAIESQIERFALGFRDCVLARHISTPVHFERRNANLAGGDISGGASDFWHLLARPVLSWNPYRTPARGLYLCSSSTPPGSGVHGMCGFHAAKAALRDLRR